MSDELHVFEMRMGPDWVIARDERDAWEVWCEHMGEKVEDYLNFDDWDPVPDDRELRIWHDNPPADKCKCRERLDACVAEADRQRTMLQKLPEPARLILWAGVTRPPPTHPNGHLKDCPIGSDTRTCRQWIQQEGRGFLCSSEA